jgi:hypothetical protein
VSAEVETDRCDVIDVESFSFYPKLGDKEPKLMKGSHTYRYCKIRDLTCVDYGYSGATSLSCVKTKGGMFR